MACLDGSQDNMDQRRLRQTASSGPMLMEPGSPLKVKLLAQIQAGPVCNHTAVYILSQFWTSYSISKREADASSSCSVSQKLPLYHRNSSPYRVTKDYRYYSITPTLMPTNP